MKPYEYPPTDITIDPIEVLASSKPHSHLRVQPLLNEKNIINPFFHKLARKQLNSDEEYQKKYKINNECTKHFRDKVQGSQVSRFIKNNTISIAKNNFLYKIFSRSINHNSKLSVASNTGE